MIAKIVIKVEEKVKLWRSFCRVYSQFKIDKRKTDQFSENSLIFYCNDSDMIR